MKIVTQWKALGVLMVLLGTKGIITGSIGYTAYARVEGSSACVVGVLMIVVGFLLLFPKKGKRE